MGFNAELGQWTVTRKAAADLRTHQYKLVKLDANGDVVLCSAAGEAVFGVLQNKPNTGEPAVVCVMGTSQINVDAALNEGDVIATSADGQAKAASRLVQATGAGSHTAGMMITDSAAAAEVATAVINPGGVRPTSDA